MSITYVEWRKNGNWNLKAQTIKGYFETAIERLTKKPKQKNQVTNLIVDFVNFNKKNKLRNNKIS